MKFASDLIARPKVMAALVIVAFPISVFAIPMAVFVFGDSLAHLDVTIPNIEPALPFYRTSVLLSAGILAGFVGFWTRIFMPASWLARRHLLRFLVATFLLVGLVAACAYILDRIRTHSGDAPSLADLLVGILGLSWLLVYLATVFNRSPHSAGSTPPREG